MNIYIVLVLYENKVQSIQSFSSQKDAEVKAIQLSNEWHKREGIDTFGKCQLETYDEMQKYYCSDTYLDCEDGAHICIESLNIDSIRD